MPAPCSAEVIALIERLLAPAPGAARLSHRQIAVLAGVGRDVVNRIAGGRYRRGQRSEVRSQKSDEEERLRVLTSDLRPPTSGPDLRPLTSAFRYPDLHARKIWCRPCWAWVAPPCLACQVRAIKAAEAAEASRKRAA